MATGAVGLPPGFVLDQTATAATAAPAALPEGFVLDDNPHGLAPSITGPLSDLARKPQPKPDRGQFNALATGAAQGLSANFADEIAGAHAAGTEGHGALYNASPLGGPLGGLLKLGYEALTGKEGEKGPATQTYERARDEARKEAKAAEEQHPGMVLAGNLAGAVALPMGGALSAPTLGGRMLRGAGVGAAYGAAAGAGEAETMGDVPGHALRGGLVGGAIGGIAPPVVEGIIQGAGAVARPLTNTVRGLVNPEAEAGRRVVTAIGRDAQAGDAGLTSAEMAAARAAGLPVANLDRGGETTRALARSAANTSPEGRASLQNLADERFEGQADRATDFLTNIVGGHTDTHATREALERAARTTNRSAYAAAERHPNAQAMWDEGFEQIMQAPVVQEAASKATTTGANRAAAEGFTPVRRPFEFHDTDTLTPRYTQRVDANGDRVLPNLQYWDNVKRSLDDKINELTRQGNTSAARDAQGLRTALVAHLDSLVPNYAAARAGAVRFFGAENAMEAGENFVRSSMTAAEGRRAFAKMTPPEQTLFRHGFVAKLIDDLNGTRDRVNVLNKIGQSPEAREKLALALGPQGHGMVEAFMHVEQVMDRLRGALGNSTTARQLVELGLAGGAGYGLSGGDFSAAGASALAAVLARKGLGRIDERVARRVADMLVSNDPRVLAQGLRTVARSGSLMNNLRQADGMLARIGGGQGPGVAGLQAAGTSRADEDQRRVPRPQGQ